MKKTLVFTAVALSLSTASVSRADLLIDGFVRGAFETAGALVDGPVRGGFLGAGSVLDGAARVGVGLASGDVGFAVNTAGQIINNTTGAALGSAGVIVNSAGQVLDTASRVAIGTAAATVGAAAEISYGSAGLVLNTAGQIIDNSTGAAIGVANAGLISALRTANVGVNVGLGTAAGLAQVGASVGANVGLAGASIAANVIDSVVGGAVSGWNNQDTQVASEILNAANAAVWSVGQAFEWNSFHSGRFVSVNHGYLSSGIYCREYQGYFNDNRGYPHIISFRDCVVGGNWVHFYQSGSSVRGNLVINVELQDPSYNQHATQLKNFVSGVGESRPRPASSWRDEEVCDYHQRYGSHSHCR